MNPFEAILSSLIGGGQSDVGRFAQPKLLPQTPQPTAATPPNIEDGNNAPHMILRRLLTGSNESPTGGQPLPELSLLPKSQLAAAAPPTPTQAPGTTTGAMPSPVTDQAQALAMFRSGQQQPTSSPAPVVPKPSGGPTASMPPFQTSVQPAQKGFMEALFGGKDGGGLTLADLLHGALSGAAMNVNNPRGLGIGAFGAGAANAMNTMRKSDKEKAAEELAKQKLKFDQTLAVRKDARAERGSNRDDEKLSLSRQDQARKNEDSKVKNRVAVDKLMQARAGTLTMDAKFKLQDQVTKYLDKLNKNGLMQPAELEAAASKKIKELEAYYGVNQPQLGGGATAPSAGAPTATGPNGQKLILQNGQWVPVQ
jgi:hypothetical protein